MILLELTTESGAVYAINVVHQRFRRVSPEGEKGEWFDYKALEGASVGERLIVHPKEPGEPLVSTPIVKVAFPKVD